MKTQTELERKVTADLNSMFGNLFQAKPQKGAPIKKPQRTKAPLSLSAPTPDRKAKAKATLKKAPTKPFETHLEKVLLSAVSKFGNNYQLAKLAGTTPDVISRFSRRERTLRADTAGRLSAALGLKLQ